MSNNKSNYNYCNIVGATDIGCKRKANEDWLVNFECANGLVAVVCDGMGGHVGGAVASHTAVDAIQSFLQQNYFDDPRTAIVTACNKANEAILQRTLQEPALEGMGSTCVMLIVRKDKVYVGSIGDSRVYLIRNHQIVQITKDQSFVQMLVDAGQITKEEAEHHPRRNEITNALGLVNMRPATVIEAPINPIAGDIFVLCSDGLSGMIGDNQILALGGAQSEFSQKQRVSNLIEAARQNGGYDNITCTLVEFSLTPDEDDDNGFFKKIKDKLHPIVQKVGQIRRLWLYVVGLLLIVSGLIVWAVIASHKDDSVEENTNEEKVEDAIVTDPVPDNSAVACVDTIATDLQLRDTNGAKIEIKDNTLVVTNPGSQPKSRSIEHGLTFSAISPQNIFTKVNQQNGVIIFTRDKGVVWTDTIVCIEFVNKDGKKKIYSIKKQSPPSEPKNNQPKHGDTTVIKIDRDTTILTLRFGKEKNTKSVLYYPDSSYVFVQGNQTKQDQDVKWYDCYCSTSSECQLTLKNITDIPKKGGVIELNLVSKEGSNEKEKEKVWIIKVIPPKEDSKNNDSSQTN